MPMAVFQSSSSTLCTRASASASSERVAISAVAVTAKCLGAGRSWPSPTPGREAEAFFSRAFSITMKAMP